MTVSDSLHSLLDYECLLFHCDCLRSNLRIGHFSFRLSAGQHSTAEHWTLLRMPNDWTLNTNQSVPNDGYLANELFHNFGRTEYKSYSSSVFLCLTVAQQWIILSLFVAAGTCLPNRCPVMDYCHGNVC
jgi:hypothetical protein